MLNSAYLEAGLEFLPVASLAGIEPQALKQAIDVYRQAYARPPYREAFSTEDVLAVFDDIFARNGDLIFGVIEGNVVSLGAGYPVNADGTDGYFLSELAVAPSRQGLGIGRKTLREQCARAVQRQAKFIELRTIAVNEVALGLYRSEGFSVGDGCEVVPNRRVDQAIRLDTRVYLSKTLAPATGVRGKTLRRIAIAYPSGNPTAILFDQLQGGDREQLNSQVMKWWKDTYPQQPELEQCGFVTLPRNPNATARLEMFGGEFCGNAGRSAVALLSGGADNEGLVEISGSPEPLKFSVKEGRVRLQMPDARCRRPSWMPNATQVEWDGMTQLVVTESEATAAATSPRSLLERLLSNDATATEIWAKPAVGVTCFDPTSSRARFCVWVRDVNTMFDETACGSGTAAIAIALANGDALAGDEISERIINVIQPSGDAILSIAKVSGDLWKSEIEGEVKVLYDGGAVLDGARSPRPGMGVLQ